MYLSFSKLFSAFCRNNPVRNVAINRFLAQIPFCIFSCFSKCYRSAGPGDEGFHLLNAMYNLMYTTFLLERIVAGVKASIRVNQWRNTHDEVLNWFDRERTGKCCFIQFDVISFYPSISEELFTKALDFAQNLTIIEEEERNILQHARNSLLFSHDGETWQKKNSLFDVTMGSYDGAETFGTLSGPRPSNRNFSGRIFFENNICKKFVKYGFTANLFF